MSEIKILIANGSALVREGLKNLIGQKADLVIIGEAENGEELSSMLDELAPDLVLIDQTSIGFQVDHIHRIKQHETRIRCLAITPEQSAQALLSAIKAGVTGYVKIDCSTQEILDAIYSTAHGRKFFCGQILDIIRESGLDYGLAPLGELNCEPIVLSDRELEVIRAIAEGMTNTQIAEHLFLSTHTINAHRRNVMTKLGVNNTAALVMYAVKSGLVSPNKYLFSA